MKTILIISLFLFGCNAQKSEAIQAAIDSAFKDKGGKMYFPKGKYYMPLLVDADSFMNAMKAKGMWISKDNNPSGESQKVIFMDLPDLDKIYKGHEAQCIYIPENQHPFRDCPQQYSDSIVR